MSNIKSYVKKLIVDLTWEMSCYEKRETVRVDNLDGILSYDYRAREVPVIKSVVSVMPAGRRRYIEILVPYLLRFREILSKHIFWLNTTDPDDIDYIKTLCREYPDFFECVESECPVEGTLSICNFFKKCTDPNTIYIRFDDDIVWADPAAISELIRCRMENPNAFLVFGNIVNNALCSYLHQRMGVVPVDIGELKYFCMCPRGWKSGQVAERIHNEFLASFDDGLSNRYAMTDWSLLSFERFSINYFAWFGSDFAEFNGYVGRDEEFWLTCVKPRELKRPNIVCGTSLVSHFAFGPQRSYLESNTCILDKYRRLSLGISS